MLVLGAKKQTNVILVTYGFRSCSHTGAMCGKGLSKLCNQVGNLFSHSLFALHIFHDESWQHSFPIFSLAAEVLY